MAWLRSGSGGNPYLRYDEDNDQIQALDTLGNWVDVYPTGHLPLIPSFDMFTTAASDYNITKEGDAASRTTTNFSNTGTVLQYGISMSAGSNAGSAAKFVTNFTIDLSNYNYLKLTGITRSYTNARQTIAYIDSNNSAHTIYTCPTAGNIDVSFSDVVDISAITGECKIQITILGYSSPNNNYPTEYLKFSEFKFMG